MIRKHMTWVFVAVLLTASASWAGQLRLGAARVSGDQVTVPIVLDGDVGKGVSTLNFKLNYDPNLFEPLAATAGKAATAADKSVQANAPAKGEYMVIMMGLDQNTVTSGEVANIVLRKVGNADNGRANVSVSQTTFASPEGVEIPSQGDQGAIQLSGKEPAPGSNQPGDTPGVPANPGQPAGSPTKDSVTPPAKPAPTTPASGQNPNSRQPSGSPTVASGQPGAQQPMGAVSGLVTPGPGKGGVSSAPGSLAAAVQRVDAAHSALQAQTGASATPGTAESPSAPDAAKTDNGVNANSTMGVDKAPPVSGTIQLAKVAAPEVSGEAQKKVLEKGVADVVESDSVQGTGGGLKVKVALGCVLVVVLGAVFVVRRKLFT